SSDRVARFHTWISGNSPGRAFTGGFERSYGTSARWVVERSSNAGGGVPASGWVRDSVADVHDQATSLPTGSSRAGKEAELSPQIGAALGQLAKRLRADKAANGAGLDLSCGGASHAS